MSDLTSIINLLREIPRKPKARCAIVSDDGFVDESSLMGTRDGYLNLVIALLETLESSEIADSSSNFEMQPENRAYWNDAIKAALHNLPTSMKDTFIVGCYVFDNHEALLKSLETHVNRLNQMNTGLRNDPEFYEP